MTQSGANDWKTPLGYYERAISELRKTQEELQSELQNLRELQDSYAILNAELQATKEQLETTQKTTNEFQVRATTAEKVANDAQTELQTIKAELQATKAEIQAAKTDIQAESTELKTDFQHIKTDIEILKENLSQSLKSIVVKYSNDKKHNSTCSSNWETLLSYELNLSTPSHVNVFAHGHGFARNYNSPLDVRIFINGSQFDEEFLGLGITHSPNWQTLVCFFTKYLNYGKHTIELKYRSRKLNSLDLVYFNYPLMLLLLTGS